jgi:hypothetical protein
MAQVQRPKFRKGRKITMFSTIIKKAAFAPALAVLTGSLLAVSPVHAQELSTPVTYVIVTSEYSAAQLETSDLLKQVRDGAIQLSKDSDQLVSLSRSNVSRASYASSLDRIKAHINRTGEQLAKLETLKNEAAPWQRAAIDRITPIAQELATNTSAAIAHINDSPNHLYAPDYRNTLLAIAEDAREMKNNLSDFLSLAEAQQKVDDLQMKILSNS